MTIPSSLQQVAAQFSQWRAGKTSSGERTPLSLRKKAVAQTNHFSVAQVSKALGLSGSQLKSWREVLSENGADDINPVPSTFCSLQRRGTAKWHQTDCDVI